jgi:small-conductance mechanosensitive channel
MNTLLVPQLRVIVAFMAGVLWLLAAAPVEAQEPASLAAERPPLIEIDAAPVRLDGRTLFRVRGVSSLDAASRARAIEGRIEAVAADRAIAADTLRVIEVDGLLRIFAGDRPIVAIAPADARLEQVLPATLAETHLGRIRRGIVDYRVDRSRAVLQPAVLRTAGAALLAIVVAVLVVFGTFRIARLADGHLQRKIGSVGIKNYELVREERVRDVFRGMLRGIGGLLLLAIALTFLSYSLGQFPWTRGTSAGLVALALGPLQTMGRGIVQQIPNLVFLAIFFVVVRFVLRFTRLLFEGIGRGFLTFSNFDAEWATPTYKIVRLAIIAFAIVVAYPYIPGSQSDAFKGVSLFVGVLLSLGSSSAIANFIAGYTLTYRRLFRIGDRVKIGGYVGDVTEQKLQVTRLRSPKNEEIVIPNSQILNGEVVNYSSLARTKGLILHTDVGIGYETPWRQVEAMLMMAAEATPGVLREPRPFVLQKALGDFAVTYELNAYCDAPQAMGTLYTALHRQVLDVFNQYGIQIMTPAYEGDPATPKIVPPDQWHVAPAAMTEPAAMTAPGAVAASGGAAAVGTVGS